MPAGGDGGVRNRNLPPPSRPHENDLDITPEHRPGIPYPEWNAWNSAFMPNHVAVIEHSRSARTSQPLATSAELRRWFQEHTHRTMTNRLEDGSDLDVEQYVSHYIDLTTGEAIEPKIFRELLPSSRDVTTALLLDGSSSLGVHGGKIFKLELACADALSRAMTAARERHGIFVFTGNTRHRVEVTCLKDFADRRCVAAGQFWADNRGLHQTWCAVASSDEPTVGSAIGTASAHRHRRWPDLRRGLRGPLCLGRRGARRRGGQRGRRLGVLHRGRPHPR